MKYTPTSAPLLTLVLIGAALALSTGCAKSADSDASASPSPAADASVAAAAPAVVTVPANGPKIRIVTSDGTMLATLDPVHAPKSTANFLKYVDTKFYDGGTFFRAVPGFVIQGGNKAKEAHDFPPIDLEDPQVTGLRNVDGALAMARTSDPNSATSEFFVDAGPQAALDGTPDSPGYAVFGIVTSGMDVVKKIISGDAPGQMLVKPIKILSIERVK